MNLALYLVTDRALCRGRTLSQLVEAAVRGGVTAVQLREKALDTRAFLAEARALKLLLKPLGIPLVINDRVDVALACEADGVHLGQGDMPIEDARRLLPAHVFLGLSVETMAHVHASASLPVDYLGVSPIFATPTKTDTARPWGLDGLREVRAHTKLPLVAIGGIHEGNARALREAGADGLAVVSAICAAEDPERAAAALRTP
ncbi:MAG TPA: thiamine phosphate synthase [Polyangiales bacterium]|nr:thiamine phosphate synthase [Polyangiales bacterium]